MIARDYAARRHLSPDGNSGGPNTKPSTRLEVRELAFDDF